jgi:hypothetical protein
LSGWILMAERHLRSDEFAEVGGAITDQVEVKKKPAPSVVFEDFGDTSLVFGNREPLLVQVIQKQDRAK